MCLSYLFFSLQTPNAFDLSHLLTGLHNSPVIYFSTQHAKVFSLCLWERPSLKICILFFIKGMGLLSSIFLTSLLVARNPFWLPTQPASTYSLNSNNHIQIRFAVKQHPISFRNRKNENMHRKAFILIHSNRMWGYHGSCKHMVQKVNICWEPLLLRSDCRNCIFSIMVCAFLLAMTICFNLHKNLILGWLQVLTYFEFNHWTFPLLPQVTFKKKGNNFYNSDPECTSYLKVSHCFTPLN